jgi:hypothetical protein
MAKYTNKKHAKALQVIASRTFTCRVPSKEYLITIIRPYLLDVKPNLSNDAGRI